MVAKREQLRPACKGWKDATMIMLSLDQSKFDSPLEAWNYVRKKRCIAELMRELKRRRLVHGPEWFYAMEFHVKGGWPHWHLVLHAGFIKYEIVRTIWGRGHVWLSRPRGFKSVDHAINYATKYIAKPDEVYPDWVLNYPGEIRRFSTSRGLCGPGRKKVAKKTGRTRKRRTIAERQAYCHSETKIMEKIETLGGHRYRHVKTLPIPWQEEFKEATVQQICESESLRNDEPKPLPKISDDDIPF